MFEFSDCVRFLPWVGKSYQAGYLGSKILVIGDSHYGKAPGLDCNFTRDVLLKHLSGEQRISFFTNIARAITGEPKEDLDQALFWSSLAFYNYVQEAVGEARDRPTMEQGINAQDAFETIIDTLQPDKIIMLGNFVWNMTPSTGHEGNPVCAAATNKTVFTWYYSTNTGKMVPTGKMEHPSSGGFSGDAWHPVVKQFLSSRG